MARYHIEEEEDSVSIEVTEVGGQQEKLLQAFGECQSGHCSCPTDEYQKLSSMDVKTAGTGIRLQLDVKPGEKLDVSQIAECLDYTTSRLSEAEKKG